WKKVNPNEVMKLQDFADLMSKTPGWEEEKITELKEFKDDARPKGHHKIYRVAASGELERVKTWQYFYLIVSAQGEQIIVTFSVVPQQVSRLGVRDLELVRDLVFTDVVRDVEPPK